MLTVQNFNAYLGSSNAEKIYYNTASKLLKIPIYQIGCYSLAEVTGSYNAFEREKVVNLLPLCDPDPTINYNHVHQRIYSTNGEKKLRVFVSQYKQIPYIVILDDPNNNDYIFATTKDLEQLFKYHKDLYATTERERPSIILNNGMFNNIIEETLGLVENKERFIELGIIPKRGLIFSGDPGNGKSMVCNYIKNEFRKKYNINTYNISNKEIEDHSTYGFHNYKVVFIDDIDISHLMRKDNHPVCASFLLNAMDGIEKHLDFKLLIITTNEKIDHIDSAFLRPGRIDSVFEFKLPDSISRFKLVETWHDRIRDVVQINNFVDQTEGLSFAELTAIQTIIGRALIYGQKIPSLSEMIAKATHGRKNKTTTPVGFQQEKQSVVVTV